MKNSSIEQVPPSLPVALPNNPNLPPTGGSGVEIAAVITALTPIIIKLLEKSGKRRK